MAGVLKFLLLILTVDLSNCLDVFHPPGCSQASSNIVYNPPQYQVPSGQVQYEMIPNLNQNGHAYGQVIYNQVPNQNGHAHGQVIYNQVPNQNGNVAEPMSAGLTFDDILQCPLLVKLFNKFSGLLFNSFSSPSASFTASRPSLGVASSKTCPLTSHKKLHRHFRSTPTLNYPNYPVHNIQNDQTVGYSGGKSIPDVPTHNSRSNLMSSKTPSTDVTKQSSQNILISTPVKLNATRTKRDTQAPSPVYIHKYLNKNSKSADSNKVTAGKDSTASIKLPDLNSPQIINAEQSEKVTIIKTTTEPDPLKKRSDTYEENKSSINQPSNDSNNNDSFDQLDIPYTPRVDEAHSSESNDERLYYPDNYYEYPLYAGDQIYSREQRYSDDYPLMSSTSAEPEEQSAPCPHQQPISHYEVTAPGGSYNLEEYVDSAARYANPLPLPLSHRSTNDNPYVDYLVNIRENSDESPY